MFVARAVAAIILILGIAGMHGSLGDPAMAGPAAMPMAESHSAPHAVMASSDSMSALVQGVMDCVMHACLFLVAAVALALLACPARLVTGAQLLPRFLTLARRRTREPRGIDRMLALCVLRI